MADIADWTMTDTIIIYTGIIFAAGLVWILE